MTDVEWGYNCLTAGIHHGRPEPLWNMPLLQAIRVFPGDVLFDLVMTRIYNDAMQYVEYGDKPAPSQEWARTVKMLSANKFARVLKSKTDEIIKYYDSTGWELQSQELVQRVQDNKLNPAYTPLHPHDSLNLLCRIIGVSCSQEASTV